MIKQVIVMRKDLKMRRGKQIAQGAHASMKVLLDKMNLFRGDDNSIHKILSLDIEGSGNDWEFNRWLEGAFTKIVVSCDSEQELLELYQQAVDADLPASLITDAGKTEFSGVATNTCIAIGPADSKKIDKITGHLKLL